MVDIDAEEQKGCFCPPSHQGLLHSVLVVW